MNKLQINLYSNFLIKFGSSGEIAKNSRNELKNLLDHLYGNQDEDCLQSLHITPVPCVFTEHDFQWFNADLEPITV
jgi:hypothetical protein